MPSLIDLQHVTKRYTRPGAPPFLALADVSLHIAQTESIAIVGKSGSGKSTLLNLIAGLDRPTEGSVQVANASLPGMSEDALARWRGRNVGIVFQFFQLLPTLTVRENILLAMDFPGVVPRAECASRTHELMALVGISAHADKLPGTLSGGEQQRAAIARALANDPPILVADEPTGNLDSQTASAVLNLFDELVARGRTLVVVTHDEEIARRAKRRVEISDGRIVEDSTIGASA